MKQSAVQQMLSDSAKHVSSQRGADMNSSYEGAILQKTISGYESLMDRAVEDFFWYGDDDELFAILKEAKENNRVPKKYMSQKIVNFNTCNIYVRKANLSYEKGMIIVRMYIGFGSVKITPNFTKITKGITINDNLGKVVKSIQETLTKVEKYIK